jgi:hypothetical protein
MVTLFQSNKQSLHPSYVQEWIQISRNVRFVPKHMSAEQYKTSWWKWWSSEQPAWRLRSKSGELCQGGTGDASSTRRCGQNGLIEFVMTLGWWGMAVDVSAKGKQVDWLKAVAEVCWVTAL